MSEFAHALDQSFDKLGAGFIPPVVRYVAVFLILCSPFIGIIFMILFDDDVPMPPAKPTTDAPKKVQEKEKREKME